jgi:membrane protease YdiL (CAAX protease family)
MFPLRIQWFLFFSGLSCDSVDRLAARRSSRQAWFLSETFGNHRKDGFVFVVPMVGLNAFFLRLQPFPPSSADHRKADTQCPFAVLMAISAGFTEEIIFRGLFLTQICILTRHLPAPVYLQAALFSLAHGARQNLAQMLGRFLMGVILAFIGLRRESFWPAILGHVFLMFLVLRCNPLGIEESFRFACLCCSRALRGPFAVFKSRGTPPPKKK